MGRTISTSIDNDNRYQHWSALVEANHASINTDIQTNIALSDQAYAKINDLIKTNNDLPATNHTFENKAGDTIATFRLQSTDFQAQVNHDFSEKLIAINKEGYTPEATTLTASINDTPTKTQEQIINEMKKELEEREALLEQEQQQLRQKIAQTNAVQAQQDPNVQENPQNQTQPREAHLHGLGSVIAGAVIRGGIFKGAKKAYEKGEQLLARSSIQGQCALLEKQINSAAFESMTPIEAQKLAKNIEKGMRDLSGMITKAQWATANTHEGKTPEGLKNLKAEMESVQHLTEHIKKLSPQITDNLAMNNVSIKLDDLNKHVTELSNRLTESLKNAIQKVSNRFEFGVAP